MIIYKHYARINGTGLVTRIYSEAFETPAEGDFLITEEGARQANYGELSMKGVPRFKVEAGVMVERSAEEVAADEAALPDPPKTELEELRELVDLLIIDSLGRG